jgi:hypothetical protein
MADRYDDRYEDESPPRRRGGSRRQRGRPARYRDRTGSDEWEEREPGRHDYGWRRRQGEERDDTDVYAREDTISFRGTRTPDYSWPPLQAGPHTGKGPKGYQRSDESVFEDACGRLSDHGWLDAGDIEVRVENGEVILEGTVPDRRSKRLAEDLVAGVRGVWDVHNRLRVPREGELGKENVD